jgi:hypothetical protein
MELKHPKYHRSIVRGCVLLALVRCT